MAGEFAGRLWLRRMENPSHDSLSTGQLRSEEDRREADRRLRQARRELGDIIKHKAEIDKYGEASNIDELADILPDQDDILGDRTLMTQVVETRSTPSDVVEIAEEIEDEGGGEGEDPGDGSGEGKGTEEGGGAGRNGNRPVRHRDQRALLRRVRYIPLSSSEAIVAFNPSSDPPGEVRLSLTPARTDGDPRGTRPVAITEATRVGDVEEPLPVNDGEIVFTPDSNDRVTIRVIADSEGGGAGRNGNRPVRHRDQRALLRRVRYIPLSSSEAIVAFNPSSDPPELTATLGGRGRSQSPRRQGSEMLRSRFR